jgi:hypothetical protein
MERFHLAEAEISPLAPLEQKWFSRCHQLPKNGSELSQNSGYSRPPAFTCGLFSR